MNTLAHEKQALARTVTFREDMMRVSLSDGREIGVPLDWFPRLKGATSAQRENFRLIAGGVGIHFPDVDEDVSVEGLLR